jgi:hypothetical protein
MHRPLTRRHATHDGHLQAVRRRVAGRRLLAALATASLAAHAATAHAAVTPSSGGSRAAFDVSFPAQSVVLDLQLSGPGRCALLYPLSISIREAQRGHFRFGPRVPGARPRRDDGKRLRRWCRGNYRVSVIATAEFDPGDIEVVATGRFSVR